MQVTIISIAIMNIWKLYKAPYNIGIVGKVRPHHGIPASLLHQPLAAVFCCLLLLCTSLSSPRPPPLRFGNFQILLRELVGELCTGGAQVPKGLPGYVGNTFFPLVGSTGGTLGLAVLVRSRL